MRKPVNGGTDRVRILEKAVGNLGDSLKRRDVEVDEDIGELKAELKALKLYLARSLPDFKKQFPEIRRKIR
jgi:hypothetical protein